MLIKKLNAPFLARTTSIVRNGRHVLDRLDIQTGRLQRRDGAFATTAGAFDPNVNFFHAILEGLFSRLLGRHLSGKWSALPAALEVARTAAGPAQSFALRVRDRYRRVVERRVNMGDPMRHITTNSFLF